MKQPTIKQSEYIKNAHSRWNIKTGATRSGKTYLDLCYTIPRRILDGKGKAGLNVMLGYTQGTLKRNIIIPLQERYGAAITNINKDGISKMFGEPVHCLGADKVNAVNRIRGSSWKWLYGDEFATYNHELFELGKSRLDKGYSIADLTCNPDSPIHWAKKFIDSDVDLFLQTYTLYDNPHLDPDFVRNLEREYAGSVWRDRFILGKWTRAEGLCYPSFKDRNILEQEPENILYVNIGCDIGGTSSATVYTAVGVFKPENNRVSICVLDEYYDKENKDTETILKNYKTFIEQSQKKWKCIDCYVDSAEQLILRSMRNMGMVNVHNSLKAPIVDRIRFWDMMYATERAYILKHCQKSIEAVQSAVWDEKAAKDIRLDDGTTNVDSLDAMEYAIERRMKELL